MRGRSGYPDLQHLVDEDLKPLASSLAVEPLKFGRYLGDAAAWLGPFRECIIFGCGCGRIVRAASLGAGEGFSRCWRFWRCLQGF